jgi:uncharacterized surface protein with fasciclin (FAS1) repeats
MRNSIGLLVCFLSLLFFFTGCRDNELEEHYGRPDWLPSPVYQQLETKGNFKNFLACVDKAGYKQTLSGAGYFTVFAPNDAAFEVFLSEQKLSGIDAIDGDMARKIVTYSLVYNSFEKSRLSDFQSNLGWMPLNAFKRRTSYYDGVYTTTTLDGQILKVTSSNRNGGYLFGDNNNKYIPYFIDAYFSAKNLTAFDYNTFYPNVAFSGFNVADAQVVTADIRAENGTVHEINKVILPLPSIEAHIANDAQYSVFKGLLDKYATFYLTHPEVTNRYRVVTGSNESVYVKFYTSSLAFSPNNENFLKVSDNDGQSDGWTMFAPTNEAVNKYFDEVLLKHYKTMDRLPLPIINDFINAHLWQTTVWPSKFASAFNFLGEEARFDLTTNIGEKKVLSNGVLYGTNKAQDADVFRSVYGQAYLNPDYSLMTRFINRELKTTITSPFVKFTLFLVPDDILVQAGYDFNVPLNEWRYNGTATLAIENWSRLINLHIALTQNNELDNLSDEGIIETYGGEFIKYKHNTVFAAGNLDADSTDVAINPLESKVVHNGIVHFADSLIRYPYGTPAKGIGFYIRDHGDVANKPYQRFYDYLKNSSMFNGTTGDITGVSSGVFHTFFIPSNTAIQQAVADGKLPANIAPPAILDKEKVINFIRYHILPKFSIIGNGKEEGPFESAYETDFGEVGVLTISNKPGIEFKITDANGRTANVVNGNASNVLGNRAVFHEIDNYLTY